MYECISWRIQALAYSYNHIHTTQLQTLFIRTRILFSYTQTIVVDVLYLFTPIHDSLSLSFTLNASMHSSVYSIGNKFVFFTLASCFRGIINLLPDAPHTHTSMDEHIYNPMYEYEYTHLYFNGQHISHTSCALTHTVSSQ